MFAKIINETTKECQVGIGTNTEYFKNHGMSEMKIEKAYNGLYYVKGYAPEKPQSVINAERIAELKQFLADADYWGQKYIDGEYTEAEWEEKKAQRKAWREEIRTLENENGEDQ